MTINSAYNYCSFSTMVKFKSNSSIIVSLLAKKGKKNITGSCFTCNFTVLKKEEQTKQVARFTLPNETGNRHKQCPIAEKDGTNNNIYMFLRCLLPLTKALTSHHHSRF